VYYFKRHLSDNLFAGLPVDHGFIDGMHLSTSVVLLDDMLPRDEHEAARDRHTGASGRGCFQGG
jgi:hypothetical protein